MPIDLLLVLGAVAGDVVGRHFAHGRPGLVQRSRDLGGSGLCRIETRHRCSGDPTADDDRFLLGIEPASLRVRHARRRRSEALARDRATGLACPPLGVYPRTAANDRCRAEHTTRHRRGVVGRNRFEALHRSTDATCESRTDLAVLEEGIHSTADVGRVVVEPLVQVVAVVDRREAVADRHREDDLVVGDVAGGVERLAAVAPHDVFEVISSRKGIDHEYVEVEPRLHLGCGDCRFEAIGIGDADEVDQIGARVARLAGRLTHADAGHEREQQHRCRREPQKATCHERGHYRWVWGLSRLSRPFGVL